MLADRYSYSYSSYEYSTVVLVLQTNLNRTKPYCTRTVLYSSDSSSSARYLHSVRYGTYNTGGNTRTSMSTRTSTASLPQPPARNKLSAGR